MHTYQQFSSKPSSIRGSGNTIINRSKLTFPLRQARKETIQEIKPKMKKTEKILKLIATKKDLKDLIQNDVENVFDLFIPQRNDLFETFLNLKIPLTNSSIETILMLLFNGLSLLMIERIKKLDVNRQKFPKLWEDKVGHFHLWLKNMLKAVDDQLSGSMLTKFMFGDLEKYLLDCLFKSSFFPKKLRKHAENVVTKKYKSAKGEADLLAILRQIKEKNGNEKMLTFLYVQVLESFGVNMSICLSNHTGNRKKKIKLYDSYKVTFVTLDLVLILLNTGNEGFSLCFGQRSGDDKKKTSPKKKIIKKINPQSTFKRFLRKDQRASLEESRQRRNSIQKHFNNHSLFETYDNRKEKSIRSNSSSSLNNFVGKNEMSAFKKSSQSPLRNTKKSLNNLKKISDSISEIKKRMKKINRVKVKVDRERKEISQEKVKSFYTRNNSQIVKPKSGAFYAHSSNISY